MGARVVAGLSFAFWAVAFYGVVDLTTPFDDNPYFTEEDYLLETGWGVLFTFLVAAAFLALAVRPGLLLPVVQVVAVAACLAVAALAAGAWLLLAPALVLGLNGVAIRRLAHGTGPPIGWGRVGIDAPVAALAVVAAPPAFAFAVGMAVAHWEGRPPRSSVTWGIHHWSTQAALPLAVVLVTLALAIGVRERWSGAVVTTVCLVVAAGWFGALSTVHPDVPGSVGRVWGQVLLGWAALLGTAVAWRLRASRERLSGGGEQERTRSDRRLATVTEPPCRPRPPRSRGRRVVGTAVAGAVLGLATALAGCGSAATNGAPTTGTPSPSATTTSVTTTPATTSATPTSTSSKTSPTTTRTAKRTTVRPPARTTSRPARVAPLTPTRAPATRVPTPSLRGDTRNSWAFAPLRGGAVTVEGSVASHKAWSTSKVLVVSAFLETVVAGVPSRLTSSQRSLVTRALSASDMDALIALRSQIPGSPGAAMNRVLRSVGDTRTVAPDTNQGGMQWAPVDQIRFLRAMWRGEVVSRASSVYLMEQMNPIRAHEWGLGTVGATNFKGGWYRSTTVTRQMGFLDGYAVVIITDHVGPSVLQSDGDYAHVQQMNLLASRLKQRLRVEVRR